MDLTICCALRDEEKVLPLTLPSIYALNPNQILFGLDRCRDRSRSIIEAQASKHNADTEIREYHEEDGLDWNFRRAYLRWDLQTYARNEVILNTAADIRLDPKLSKILTQIPDKYKLISIGYLDYPYTWQTWLRQIAAATHLFYGFAGVVAVSRSAWLETEDEKSLKKIYLGEDTHLHKAIKSKYSALYTNTHTLHLRPNEDKSHHYRRGVAQWETLHKSYPSSFIHSLLLLRPAAFTGYRHARKGLITASRIAYLPILFTAGLVASLENTPEEVE